MGLFQNLSFKRKLILAFCTILASALIVFGLVLAGTATNAAGESASTETTQASASENGGEEAVIRPSHDYHTVTASLRTGAKIYVDKTTADQLKSNLIVEGTFQVSGTNYSVKLKPEEYTVSCNDVTGNNVLFVNNAPTSVVTVTVTANNYTTTFEIAVADIEKVIVKDDVPQYKSINVKTISSISSDYTAETLIYAPGFSITGTFENGETETIANYEFVEIVMTDDGFTVIYTNPDGKTVSANGTITNVTSPTYLTSVLQVNPAYTEKGDYWYDGERSVFVYNMSRADFLKGLKLTVYYQNGERDLDLSLLTGASHTYPTGETVSIPNDFTFNSQSSAITLPLSVTIGSNNYSVSVKVNLEARQVVSIAVDGLDADGVYNYTGATLTSGTASSTVLSTLVGKVKATYNSGSSETLNATSNAGLTISEPALTPTALDIGKDTYLKTLTLVYTANDTSGKAYSVSTQFKVNVKYELPSMIVPAFGGNLVSQTYRRSIDYSGLNVQVMYPGNYSLISIPLSDFAAEGKNYVTTTFKDDGGNALKDNNGKAIDKFTEDVKSIEIVFTYNTSASADPVTITRTFSVGTDFTVNKLPLTLPDIGAFEVTYNRNLSTDGKEISFSEDFDKTAFDNLTVSVTGGNGAKTEGKTKVYFEVAGTYELHFVLHTDDTDEVEWNNRNVNAQYVTINGDELIYKIVIAPSEVKVRVTLDATKTTYGDEIGYKVSFAPMGTNNWSDLTDVPSKTNTTATITYKGINGTSYSDTAYPRNVGEYSVEVKIESSAYIAKAYLDAPSFTITPKELDAGKIKSFSYDRTPRKVSAFIDSNAFGFVVAYGDNVTNTMTAKGSDGNIINLSTKEYTNVTDSDTLTFTLTSKNYNWKNASDGTTQKIKIEITALELDFTITENNVGNNNYLDFIYGGKQNVGGTVTDMSSLTAPITTNATKDKDGTDLGVGRFYAETVTEYYKAGDFNTTTGTPTGTPLTTDFKTWEYNGENGYVAYIYTSLDSQDVSGDYNLPSHFVTFTVQRAQITKVTFTDDRNSTTYAANNIELNLVDWQDKKMTAAVTSTVTTVGTNVDNTSGEITVKHAGIYTITVTLDNNYDWNVADTQDATYHYAVTFTYTVNQKEVEFTLTPDSFQYDGTAKRPTVSLTGDTAKELTTVSGNAVIYNTDINENKTGSALATDPSDVGKYYIEVVKWTAIDTSVYDVAKNYTISGTVFDILTSSMARPTLIANGGTLSDKTITVTYNGGVFNYENYIQDFDTNYKYGTSNYKITRNVSSVSSGSRELQDVGTYTITFTPGSSFNWDTSTPENEDRTPYVFTFVITTKKLTGLKWDNLTFTYDGESHVPTATPEGLCVTADDVKVTVTGAQTDYSATAYTATASALTGAQGFNYTLPDDKTKDFTISKRSINVPTYTATTLTYGVNNSLAFTLNEGFTGVTGWSWAGVVSAGITSTVTTDGASFDFANKQFKFINAGTYTVTFTINNDNYCWNDDNNTVTGINGNKYTVSGIVVNKLEINAPSISGSSANLAFNGESQSLAFNTTKVSGFTADWSAVVSYTISGKYNFDGVTKAHSATGGIADGTSFDFANGKFNFKNAGDYTITFSLIDTNNYEWKNTNVSNVTVNRMKITAPKLVDPKDAQASGRTLEYDGAKRTPKLVWGGGWNDDDFTITYGEYDNDYAGECDPKDYGQYYVRIKLKDAELNPLNYVWEKNGNDNDYSYLNGSDKTVYAYIGSAADVSIYLNFAITKQIFTVKYSEGNYTFGDNGYYEGQTVRYEQDKIEHAKNGTVETDYFFHLVEGDDYDNVNKENYTITFTFYSLNDLTDEYDNNRTQIAEDNLVGGLPWNAGIYGVYIYLVFTDENTMFENIPVWITFEVEARPITVEWYNGETKLNENEVPEFEYDNAPHTLKAIITNVPQRTESGADEKAPVLTVVNAAEGEDLPINASGSEYTLKVGDIIDLEEGGNVVALAANYKNGNFTWNIKINKRAIAVEITNGGTSEYGYALDTTTVTWGYATDSKEFADESHKAYVTYELQKGGTTVTKYNADTYAIVAKLTSAGTVNYELTCATNGSYTVTPRAITVSLDTTKTSKTYGTEVNLYSPAVYKVEYKGTDYTDEAWLASGDTRANVFEVTSDASAAGATVKTYDIVLDIKTNSNYTVSCTAADWKDAFTVTEAEIVVAGVTGSNWEYDATAHALLTAVTVSGVTLQGGMTATYYYSKDNGTTWNDAAGVTLKNVADSGTYIIKISADNHTDEILDGVVVTISKATLTVVLNLEIYYSEESPAEKSFLMNASNLNDSRYTVEGFAGAEGSKETLTEVNASGTLSYTTNYAKGNVAKDYTLELNLAGLSSDNYNFAAAVNGEGNQTSKLTVKKLHISVEVSNTTATYWSLIGQASPVYGKITLSTTDEDTYDSSKTVDITGISAKDILTYETGAITVDGNDKVTDMADVDTYTVTVKSKDIAGKYILNTVSADGAEVKTANFEITNADLYELATVTGYNAKYDEAYHTLTVDGDYAKTYNSAKNTLTVKYYVANKVLTDSELSSVSWVEALPEFINVGTYYLYYNLSASNHNSETKYVVITITKADNAINPHFGFAGKDTVFASAEDVDKDAWIYGVGYSSKGVIVEPVAKFDGVPEGGSGTAVQFVFTLYYNGELVDIDGTYNTAEALFAAVLGAGLFNAGAYRIHYEMDETANFNGVYGDRYFRVGQKPLTITANNVEVIYGEKVSPDKYTEAAGYNFTVAGLENNGKNDDTINDVFGGTLPKFISAYEQGSFVGDYTIAIDDATYTSTNYDVTFISGTLTVVQREITIVIESKQSSFHYYNDNGEAKELTYSFYAENGTKFYTEDIDGDQLNTKVFTLYTNATLAQNGFATQNVGTYPIFAVFNYIAGDAKNRTYAHNYIINIVAKGDNALYEKSVTPEIIGAVNPELSVGNLIANAGVYTITPAQLQLNPDENPSYAETSTGELSEYSDPTESRIYDGYYKGFTASVTDNGVSMAGVTFYAKYGTEQNIETMHREMYKDVGTYYYRFVTDNPNYEWNQGGFNTLTIRPRTITVTSTLDGNNEFLRTQTYKNGDYVLEFTFNGLQRSEIIDLVATVTPTAYAGSDTYFNSYLNQIYGTFATTNDADANTYTLSVKNTGVYAITFNLADNAAMKNYSFTYSYEFTVQRANFTVRANSSVVQYGTAINQSGTAQPMSGVTESSYTGVSSENWNEVADYYRFYGFSLIQNVHDKVDDEGKINGTNIDYFYIGGATYGFNGTAYSAATTQAFNNGQHTVLNIEPVASSIHAFNYNIVTTVNNTDYGKLYVAQRRIDVTVNGYNLNNVSGTSFASTIYSGEEQQPDYSANASDFFTPETGWYGAATGDNNKFLEKTATKLSVLNAVNAGDYDMHAFQNDHIDGTTVTNNTNYKITFVNDNQALFHIDKKNIRLQVVYAKDDTNSTSFDIIYGDQTEGYYKVIYYGIVPKDGGTSDGTPVDKYTLTNGTSEGGIKFQERYTQNGTTAGDGFYKQWESHAGEKFLIDIRSSDLSFDNYNIVSKDFAVMTVIARKVTATTSDRIYTEDTNLHGGDYGIEHDAKITFTDVKDGSISYTDSAFAPFAPNNYLSYLYVGTENGGNAYNSSTAPTRAGQYTVKITFNANTNYGDFIFDTVAQTGKDISSTSVTFDYNVNKKAISLYWDSLEDLTFNEGDEKYVLITSPYVEALTVVNYVQLIKSDSTVETIERYTDGGNPGDGQYAVTNDGFTVKVYSVGTYSALIVLNSDAVNNYKWDDEDTMQSLSLAFSAYAEGFNITELEMESWTYNDVDDNGELIEHKPTYKLTNGVEVPIAFSYATVTGELPEGVTVGNPFDTDVFQSIKNKTSASTNIPVNAGMYILVANYTGVGYSSTSAYVIFEIYQREVEAPVFVQAEKDYVYTGEEQTAEIKYSHSEVTGAYTGNSSLGADGITLSATDAKTYRIVFSLNNTRNYKWAEGVTNGATYAIEWTIAPAEDNEVLWGEEISVTYGDAILPEARSTYGGSLTQYYFATRNPAHTSAPADVEWTLWTEEAQPVNSGYYWVKAVDEGTANYNSCEAAQKITINKAWLTVTANGSAIYGDGEDMRHFGYEFSGFVKGTEDVTVGNIEYVLEAADKYNAGTYGVQLKAVTQVGGKDVVEGMSAENYYITPAVGEFTVSRRSITVILGSARSVYGSLIDLSQIEIRVVTPNGLAEGDTIADLGIALEVDADRNVDIASKFNGVGAYTVNGVGYEDNENYNITVFGSGTYTVAPLSIYITTEAGGGTYDSGNIQGAKITGIYTLADEDVTELFGDRAPTFRFNYWGTSNDGKWDKVNSDNWNTEPDRAGIYHATAVASNSDNFTLLTNMGMPSVTFTVEKKVIDESVISIEKQAYSGTALTPVVTDKVYRGIYTVGEVSATEVGTHNVPVTLIDPCNYKWTSVDDAVCNLTFEIVRGENVIEKLEIKGWTYLAYDAANNTPTAEVRFGSAEDFVFAYSASKDGEYSANVPTNAGKYWVTVTVPQTDNYYIVTSDPVEFEISKAELSAPTLVTVSEGEAQNTVYTGSRLQAVVEGYDSKAMRIVYDGDSSVSNTIAVFALNAGTYSVKFVLNDANNYVWAENVSLDGEGNATLTWTIARKKLAKPTMTSEMYMVNGKVLTFIPTGFDEATMNISGNQTSYGGVFDVIVSLKDSSNYEWSDSSVDNVTLAWVVVGWDTVFIIVVSVLGVVAGIAAAVIGIQYAVHKRKKRKELELEAAAEAAATSPAGSDANQPAENKEPENKEPENKEPENKEPENKEPENKEPENKEPENKEPENKEPENKEPENKEPENKEPENKEPETKEPENKEPENKEPENKEPEDKEPVNNTEEEDGGDIDE